MAAFPAFITLPKNVQILGSSNRGVGGLCHGGWVGQIRALQMVGPGKLRCLTDGDSG